MLEISSDLSIFKMCKTNTQAAVANPCDVVIFNTADCFYNEIKSEDFLLNNINWDRINPATGPLYINTAEPGDVLAVTIEEIKIKDQGLTMTVLGEGPLGNKISKTAIKIINIKDDKAIWDEKIHLPLNKMVGVIGTAPAGESIANGVPCMHGGNMDCKEIKEGATVYLPVNVPGALLSMGDLHAVMADGEVGISGLEIAGEVKVRVDVIKNRQMPTPMIENDTHIMTIASHKNLDQAADMAVENMWQYLIDNYSFNKEEAAMFLSLVGETKICQIVDPQKTVRVEVLKKYLL